VLSMGYEHESTKRAPIFRPFQVNEASVQKAASNAVFMHCLPARRNAEVTDAVLDGPQSIVFDQARIACTRRRRCCYCCLAIGDVAQFSAR